MVTSIVAYFLPGFPEEIWQSITALVMVLIGAIAVEDAALKLGGGKRE